VTDHVDATKVKHRKHHRGRLTGTAKGGTEVSFGQYGIQALEPGGSPPARSRQLVSP
jgi:ribosomal protein L16/L10AE